MFDGFDAIPRGRYQTILVDPPWRFLTRSERNQTRATSRHYPVLGLRDIMALPVAELAAPDCVLFLWSINPMQPQALQVIENWGFSFKSVAFTWAKRTPLDKGWNYGLGFWTRQNTERCLLATRGRPKRLSKAVPELLIAPRGRHSGKPVETYRRIEALVSGPYLELFARPPLRPGWDCWGLDVDGFAPAADLMGAA